MAKGSSSIQSSQERIEINCEMQRGQKAKAQCNPCFKLTFRKDEVESFEDEVGIHRGILQKNNQTEITTKSEAETYRDQTNHSAKTGIVCQEIFLRFRSTSPCQCASIDTVHHEGPYDRSCPAHSLL